MKMNRAAAALILGACVACAGEKPAEQPPAAAPATTAAAVTTTPASAAQAAATVGVAECDEFLTKYYACLDANVPAETRPSLKQSADMMAASWRQTVAAGPQAKAALATGCKQSQDQAKLSMAAYKCTW